ncbi:MAG: hypothetical protein IMW83_03665 [Caldanaerobacter subterraneus]|nr:hypothetical protein [Caldanaerobacter subterraneus]
MTKNLLLTTTNIINNTVRNAVSFLTIFVEFTIIVGSFVITILIILNIPSITEEEKKLENLSEKEKEIIIAKANIRWTLSVFFLGEYYLLYFFYIQKTYYAAY